MFEMTSCTQDEWVDFLSDYRTYNTEYIYGQHSVMYSKLSQGACTGEIIAEVHYCENGNKFYFIADIKTED